MGKVTLYIPNDVKDYVFRYMEDDEQIKSYFVADTLPKAKEFIITKLRILIEQAEQLKLKDLNDNSK